MSDFRILKLNNGEEIEFKQGIFSITEKTVWLRIRRDENKSHIINDFNELKSDKIKDSTIEINYNDSVLSCTIQFIQTRELIPEPDFLNIKCFITNIKNNKKLADYNNLHFFIPYIQVTHTHWENLGVNIGGGYVKTLFEFNNNKWVINNAISNELSAVGYIKPHEAFPKAPQKGLILEVEIKENSEYKKLKKDADSICILMGLALGGTVMWKISSVSSNENYELFGYSDRVLQTCEQKLASTVFNAPPQFICYPTDFIKIVESEYRKNKAWWDITINWLLSSISTPIEYQGLVAGMLFDRITNRVEPHLHNADNNADNNEAILNKNKKTICDSLYKIIKQHIPEWKLEQNNNLYSTVVSMNTKLSYITKIEKLFQLGNRNAAELVEAKKILKKRNFIVHEGELNLKNIEPSEYFFIVSREIRLVIFAMLGYSGKFKIWDKVYEVNQILPDYQKMLLSNIESQK